MTRLPAAWILVFGLMGSPVSAQAAEPVPDPASLLFDEPQLASTKPGDVLTYAYSRKSPDAAGFGPSFEDRIQLVIDQGSSADTRTVEAQLFSGERRRPAGPFGDMIGNPLLSLVLEDNVESLAKRFSANPRYFKTAIRAAFRDKAMIVADSIDVGGRPEAGWRISITPFKDDPNNARMSGLETLTYQFRVTKSVPGEIVEISISAPSATGVPLLEEKVNYVVKAE